MKRNNVCLVGSIFGCLNIFLLEAPLLVYTNSSNSASNTYLTLEKFLQVDYYGGLAIMAPMLAFLSSFLALFISIKGGVENKNTSGKTFVITAMGLVMFFLCFRYLLNQAEESKYAIGWGAIVQFILYIISFILCWVGMSKEAHDDEDNYAYKRRGNENVESLAKYKSMLNDLVSLQNEFDIQRKDSISKNR